MPLQVLDKILRLSKDYVLMESKRCDVAEEECGNGGGDVPDMPSKEQKIDTNLHNCRSTATDKVEEDLVSMALQCISHAIIVLPRRAGRNLLPDESARSALQWEATDREGTVPDRFH